MRLSVLSDTARAMSEENVEIVRRMYEAFHSGDADRALTYFAPDVSVDATARPGGGIGRGHEVLNRVVGEWVGTFEDWREEIEAMDDLGNRVLVVTTQRGRGKGSGVEVEARWAALYEIQSGKITALTMYDGRAEALKAAGLSE